MNISGWLSEKTVQGIPGRFRVFRRYCVLFLHRPDQVLPAPARTGRAVVRDRYPGPAGQAGERF